MQQFLSVTATADAEAARRYLSVTASLEDAVNLFFEGGEQALSDAHAAPAPEPAGDASLSAQERAYFVAQDRLEALRAEYNNRFTIKRRLSEFLFSKEPTNASEFAAAYPRFPLAVERNALGDLLRFFPFMVAKPLLAVVLAPARPSAAELEAVERGPLAGAELAALLEQHAVVTAAVAGGAAAAALEELGVEQRRAPLLALVGLDLHSNAILVGVVELRRGEDPAPGLRALLDRYAERRRAHERFVTGLGEGRPASPPRAPDVRVAEERRLRQEQERAYQQMVAQHAQELEARAADQRRVAEVDQRRAERAALARSFTEESIAPGRAVTLQIRLPSGRKLVHRFDAHATFQRVHDFVSTLEETGFADPLAPFELRAGFPPATLPLAQPIAQRFPDSAQESIEVKELSAD